jgi:hypothetical protein
VGGDHAVTGRGNTLVVDTTNYSDKIGFRGAGENLHVTERFTRVRCRIDSLRIHRRRSHHVDAIVECGNTDEVSRAAFEYACTEGNYGLANILRGARVGDAKAGAAAKANPD